MTQEEQAEMLMFQRLLQQASGVDMYGQPLKNEEHRAAVEALEQLKARRDQRKNEQQRLQLEKDKQLAAVEAERARIAIEAEKVQVQKAEVFVRAMEVAVHAGLDQQAILTVLTGFGDKLLSGGSAIQHLLGDSNGGAEPHQMAGRNLNPRGSGS
ncbi:MAG: hypothetical protein EBS90_11500 [Betaproteobacteria bacterium]|nr:hypothetical protein [Betaproteobacteria bacterium]